MSSRIHSVSAAPQLGGKAGVILFIFTLLGFTVESQLTQFVQTNLHYRQPFFIFYLVHSSFALILPFHLFYLAATTKYTIAALLAGLRLSVVNHLAPNADPRSGSRPFPILKFTWLIVALTIGVTLPAVLWFAAVSLASVSDVTAIWNTNAFFAYLISIKLLGLKLETRKMVAVVLATVGVGLVVYGGTGVKGGDNSAAVQSVLNGPSAPVIGNILTLVASVGYGLYQVLYKIYGALPLDLDTKEDNDYRTVPEDELAAEQLSHSVELEDDVVYPPPFGLHPNLIVSLIGITTSILLWIFLPILHNTGAEIFHLPKDWLTTLSITGIALSGIIFNSGLMVLLGMWGPVITSVGNLLTIVLVLISDLIFGNAIDTLTVWSLVGCFAIVIAFGVLAYDMFTHSSSE